MLGELQKEIAPFKNTCGCFVEEASSQGHGGGWEQDALHRVQVTWRVWAWREVDASARPRARESGQG